MLAALGPFTEQGIAIRDAKELRVKESDRIAALAAALRAMGAQRGRISGWIASGRRAQREACAARKLIRKNDHRIAMAMAIAALGAEGESVILDADCAAISFPEFFPTLERLVEK